MVSVETIDLQSQRLKVAKETTLTPQEGGIIYVNMQVLLLLQ